jgi:hypothetical protein
MKINFMPICTMWLVNLQLYFLEASDYWIVYGKIKVSELIVNLFFIDLMVY